MKKTIRVYFTDFGNLDRHNNFLVNLLKERYNVAIDEKNPDFLFYSCGNYDHLNYNCVKIFYTGENTCPDFNATDYAIGFDYISFEDRYFRLPLFQLYSKPLYIDENPLERKFCNFIYSNKNNSHPYRQELFNALSSYKHIDSGGKVFNNIGMKIKNKIAWQKEYKFSFACENASQNGYTTEKILDALQANTVPIYWGNPLIEEDFSKDCFINAMDFSSMNELIEHIKYIDQNDEEYLKILNAPWQPNKKIK